MKTTSNGDIYENPFIDLLLQIPEYRQAAECLKETPVPEPEIAGTGKPPHQTLKSSDHQINNLPGVH